MVFSGGGINHTARRREASHANDAPGAREKQPINHLRHHSSPPLSEFTCCHCVCRPWLMFLFPRRSSSAARALMRLGAAQLRWQPAAQPKCLFLFLLRQHQRRIIFIRTHARVHQISLCYFLTRRQLGSLQLIQKCLFLWWINKMWLVFIIFKVSLLYWLLLSIKKSNMQCSNALKPI